MERLNEQIVALTQQLASQEARFGKIQQTKFQLNADQVIRNFNEIPPFSGEDAYKLKSFLKTVSAVEGLCGENNIELKQYCLARLVNSKIIGKAREAILEIPEGERNWQRTVQTLFLRFRPKQTIHQLLYIAKEIKVFNLKDAFNKLTKIKSEANEICDFDDENYFTYHAIDRELVQILKSKVNPIVQLQIDQTKNLFELDNIFCQSEIYLSEDIIKYSYKINKANDRNFPNNTKRMNNTVHNKYNNSNKTPNYNQNNNNVKPRAFNNFTREQNFTNNYPRQNRFYNNSGQYRSYNYNNQYRDQNRSGQSRLNYNQQNKTEPMEIDNINKDDYINQEVNFTD